MSDDAVARGRVAGRGGRPFNGAQAAGNHAPTPLQRSTRGDLVAVLLHIAVRDFEALARAARRRRMAPLAFIEQTLEVLAVEVRARGHLPGGREAAGE